jgi:hypothetical protein
MFATRPFWRFQTQGAWAMAINAMANWNALRPPPAAATTANGGADRTP